MVALVWSVDAMVFRSVVAAGGCSVLAGSIAGWIVCCLFVGAV